MRPKKARSKWCHKIVCAIHFAHSFKAPGGNNCVSVQIITSQKLNMRPLIKGSDALEIVGHMCCRKIDVQKDFLPGGGFGETNLSGSDRNGFLRACHLFAVWFCNSQSAVGIPYRSDPPSAVYFQFSDVIRKIAVGLICLLPVFYRTTNKDFRGQNMSL